MTTVFTEDVQALSALATLERARNKTMLITGATGALGAYLTAALAEANHARGLDNTIYALCRDEAKARRLFSSTGARLILQDVSDPLPGVRFDYILHCAGPVGPRAFRDTPEEVLSANVIGTMNLLAHAAATGCEGFVFASTHEVYGETDKQTVPEADMGVLDTMSARSCYAQGKRTAETALACYYEKHGLRAMSARLSRFYGPMMNLSSGLFVCEFFRDVLANRPVRVRGDAQLLRPLCYISDAAAAMLYLLFDGEGGQAYNVQGDETPTIGDIAEAVANLGGTGAELSLPETIGAAPHGQALDTAKLQRLGWKQSVPLLDGLERTFCHLREAAR